MEHIEVKFERKGLAMESNREDVAMALKTWRLRSGLTQTDVAKRWNMSRWTILRVERAKNVSWEMAYRIFALLSEELRKENQE
jgi:DNA-binding XRE family transcriptional regulator